MQQTSLYGMLFGGATLSSGHIGKDCRTKGSQNSHPKLRYLRPFSSLNNDHSKKLPVRVSSRLHIQGSRAGPKSDVQTNPGKKDNELQHLPRLANTLLMNAASLIRPERSTAYCIVCRGQGFITCSVCKGAGILTPERVAKMNSMKHAVNKFRSLLLGGGSASMYDQDWVKSNRCKRCSGTGKIVCSACEGTGRRRS